ncbi:hypothetical protein NC652_029293 [Populus alba x Populus x berolinensis]|nr:hypothetical protein NC652_029293 [Populus alba x Populus x berolinensis]
MILLQSILFILPGFGTDTSAVISILAHRDAAQRALIQQEYRALYAEDLLKRLTSELTGKLETAVLLWMHDLPGRDAIIVRQALIADILNLETATEVICSRTSSQIQVFKQHYYAKFGVHLEHDIELRASGDHKKLLLAYVSTPRYEGREVDRNMVEKDAKALYKAGERRLGTDEKTFIRVFSERSAAHLAAVDSAYHNMYGNSLKKVNFLKCSLASLSSRGYSVRQIHLKQFQAIKKETSGHFEHALKTILQCSENPAMYFVKVSF